MPTRCTPTHPQGNYSEVLVRLSNCYSVLRGDASGEKNEDSAQVGGGLQGWFHSSL